MRATRAYRFAMLATAASVLCPLHVAAAPVAWTDGSGFWDIASNWSTALPGVADDVTIDLAGAQTVTVRSNGGPFAANSIQMSGPGALAITNGTLTLEGLVSVSNPTGASILSRLNQGGGILGGAGPVTVSGDASLATGRHSGSGTTRLQGASSLSGFNLDAGRVLRNEGTATLTGGLNLNATAAPGAGRIENAAGALFDVRTFNLAIVASSFAGDTAADARIDNAGIFRKSTSRGYAINVPFYNLAGGSIDLQSGSFAFNAGGSHAGAVTRAADTALNLGGGTHEVVSGATFTGAGALTVSGAATVVNLRAPMTVQSAFTMSGGTIDGADLTLHGTTLLAVSSSLAVMSGTGTTRLTGASRVGGGANNPFGLDSGRVLRNEGTMVITGVINLNRLAAAGSGRIDNGASAVIDVQTFNQAIVASAFAGDSGADALVNNAGVFKKSTSGGYAINVPFMNLGLGTVQVEAGSLAFNAGSSHSGAVVLSAGSGLTLGGGTHDIHASATITGPGTLTLAGAGTTLNVLTASTVQSAFAMSGGTVKGADLTLKGPNTLAISSSLGVMAGTGTTVLQGASLVSGGRNNPFGLDSGRVLRNEGTMTITGVLDLNRLDATGAGRIHNVAGALIDVTTFNQAIAATDWRSTNPLDTGADALVDNAGTFRKSGRGTYGVFVRFQNTGRVEVLEGGLNLASFSNAGTTHVAAGASLTIADPSFVNAGRITGSGTVIAPSVGLVNAGTIAPGSSPGALTIDGNLRLGSAGILEIELGGRDPGTFDTLSIEGNALLGGELAVIRLAGYVPVLGDSFTILQFTGHGSTEFAAKSFAGFGAGVEFDVIYNNASVVLNVIAVPEPATWALMLAGLGLVGYAARRCRSA